MSTWTVPLPDPALLPHYFLVFLRLGGFFLATPVFGRRTLPAQFKVGFCLLLTLLLVPVQDLPAEPADYPVVTFALLILQETGIGLILGFVGQVFFGLTQVAGQIMDVELGLGIGSVLDPQTYTQSPLSGVFLNLGLLLYFLANNGHLHLIRILSQSFQLAPVGTALSWMALAPLAIAQFTSAFSLAVSLSLPLIGASLLVEVFLGILMRSIPQIHAYTVGIPMKTLLGVVVLLGMQPLYGPFAEKVFEQLFAASVQTVQLLGGVA
ncbi:MAG: flagellar biosynthetic protein FliR [Eubacteriales bacterium]|nr:flagellar biosynthetic protein FliR [Eubacteriales bacterium]